MNYVRLWLLRLFWSMRTPVFLLFYPPVCVSLGVWPIRALDCSPLLSPHLSTCTRQLQLQPAACNLLFLCKCLLFPHNGRPLLGSSIFFLNLALLCSDVLRDYCFPPPALSAVPGSLFVSGVCSTTIYVICIPSNSPLLSLPASLQFLFKLLLCLLLGMQFKLSAPPINFLDKENM